MMTFALVFSVSVAIYTVGFYLGRKSAQLEHTQCIVLGQKNVHDIMKTV